MSFLFPRVRLRPMIADSNFQQRFRSAQPFHDSTYYYNKVKRRPAQLRFLMIWTTIKLANSGLPPWFEGKPEKVFFSSKQGSWDRNFGSPGWFQKRRKMSVSFVNFSPEGRRSQKKQSQSGSFALLFARKKASNRLASSKKGRKASFPEKKERRAKFVAQKGLRGNVPTGENVGRCDRTVT